MKNYYMAAFFIVVFLTFGSFIALANENCGWQTWKCWSQKTRLVSDGAFYEGLPVWSDDDKAIAGVEQRYETRLDLKNWPLQSIWTERHHEYRFVIQTANDLKPNPINDYRPGIITELYYMRRLGYILFKRMIHDPGYYIYHEESGAEWFVSEIVPFENDYKIYIKALPSPNGKIIAVLRCEGSILIPDKQRTPVFPNLCEASFLSVEEGLKIFHSVSGIFLPTTPPFEEIAPNKGLSQLPRTRWTVDGKLLVTDWQEVAFQVSTDAAVPLRIGIPQCIGPGTSSSRISQFGDLAIISRDRFAASDKLGNLQDSFGCKKSFSDFAYQ
ncbi:MAG: hypothetical protein ACOH5I_07160 [Oligoflexus sp.]